MKTNCKLLVIQDDEIGADGKFPRFVEDEIQKSDLVIFKNQVIKNRFGIRGKIVSEKN